MPPAIAIVLKGYPRLSETFIAQEIAALEALGFDLRLISLRYPTERKRHPLHETIRAPVLYLPEYLYQEPLRVWRAWRKLRKTAGYRAARRAWLKDLRRDATPNRVRRFGQALVLAAERAPDVAWLHAHFLHTPTSVARYAAILSGLPFSISAHAKDIWTIPDWEAAEKLAAARFAVTCTKAGAARLRALAPPGRVDLIYHGLDLARFPKPETPRPPRDGADASQPVTLISVGRLVEKKGYEDLLRALSLLPADLHWRFRHIGDGPLKAPLRRLAADLGIADRVTWLGPEPQGVVIAELRQADLFVLASRIAKDGDRDGLPNVLMGAASQELACVATRISGIPELIEDGASGVLVAPNDGAALAQALAALIRDAPRRRWLGESARARLARDFASAPGIARLAAKFAAAGTAAATPGPADIAAAEAAARAPSAGA